MYVCVYMCMFVCVYVCVHACVRVHSFRRVVSCTQTNECVVFLKMKQGREWRDERIGRVCACLCVSVCVCISVCLFQKRQLFLPKLGGKGEKKEK